MGKYNSSRFTTFRNDCVLLASSKTQKDIDAARQYIEDAVETERMTKEDGELLWALSRRIDVGSDANISLEVYQQLTQRAEKAETTEDVTQALQEMAEAYRVGSINNTDFGVLCRLMLRQDAEE